MLFFHTKASLHPASGQRSFANEGLRIRKTQVTALRNWDNMKISWFLTAERDQKSIKLKLVLLIEEIHFILAKFNFTIFPAAFHNSVSFNKLEKGQSLARVRFCAKALVEACQPSMVVARKDVAVVESLIVLGWKRLYVFNSRPVFGT